MRPHLLPFLLLIAAALPAEAQYLVFGGVSDAVNQFGDTNGVGAGFAGYGFAVGFDYEVPSEYERGVSVVVGAALITSSFDADAFAGGAAASASAQPYINVPLSFGFRYRVPGRSRISPILGGRVLYTFSRFPRLEIEDPALSGPAEVEAAGAGGFGLAGDVGVAIGDALDVGLRYYGMGTRRYDIEVNVEGAGTVIAFDDQPTSVAVLYAAYRL